MVDFHHPELSVNLQCRLLGLNRSTVYYRPVREYSTDLTLKGLIDREYTRHPFLGYRKMTDFLQKQGYKINGKRVRRLMREMGIQAVYPKPRLSIPDKQHKKFPYLLKGMEITRVNQVWSMDITYIRLNQGFIYLTAVIDLHSRYVLSWRVSNTLDSGFCVEALKEALTYGTPGIFNTDQGVQFTSEGFIGVLENAGILISMDGKGRALDNIFIERLWRSVKYEEVYLKDYADPREAISELKEYFRYYDHERPHQSLGYKTPASIYFSPVDKTGKAA